MTILSVTSVKIWSLKIALNIANIISTSVLCTLNDCLQLVGLSEMTENEIVKHIVKGD